MKNKLIDLNNHLFAALEKLNDDDLKGDELKEELARTKGVTGLAREVINNAKLALDAQTLLGNGIVLSTPEMIGVDKT